MTSNECYTLEELRDFAFGRLSVDRAGGVVAHLEQCEVCEDTISSLDSTADSLVDFLRLPGPRLNEPGDRNYSSALKSVKRMVHSDAAAEPHTLAGDPGNPTAPIRIRDYQLVEKLGEGGMGTVYKAIHTRLDRVVALKLLPGQRLRNEQAVARFQREMKAIGQLDHPAIVRATDAGEADGAHFLVMELVEGVDLSELVRRLGPVSVPQACEIVRQAALGLQHVHEQGLVHRDIKPSNLMLAPDGTVRILDLGLALLSNQQASVDELTTVGQLMGTLDYMAPEQCDDSHEVDIRADMYAMGATLFKLLTGSAPYDSPDRRSPLARMKALATEPVPPVRERAADLPGELADLIQQMLSRDPADRPETPAAVAGLLQQWSNADGLSGLTEEVIEAREREAADMPESLATVGAPVLSSPPVDAPPAAHHGPKQRSSWFSTVISLFVTGAIAAAGIVFYVKTGMGDLVIECAEPNVQVELLRSGKVYDNVQLDQGENTVTVRAGEYEIRLPGRSDSLELSENRFTLKRGERWFARITHMPTTGSSLSMSAADADPDLASNVSGIRAVPPGSESDSTPSTAAGSIAEPSLPLWLKRTLIELEMELRTARAKYSSDHPQIARIRNDMDVLREQLDELEREAAKPKFDGRTYEEWMSLLRTERSPALLANGLKALVALGGSDRGDEIIESMIHVVRELSSGGRSILSDQAIRDVCLNVLTNIDSRDAARRLIQELQGENQSTATFAATIVANSRHNKPLGTHFLALERDLAALVTHPAPETRLRVVDLVRNKALRFELVETQLREMLDDAAPGLRAHAAAVLAEFAPDSPGIAESLGTVLDDGNEFDRAVATYTLEALGERARPAVPQLLKRLVNPRWGIRNDSRTNSLTGAVEEPIRNRAIRLIGKLSTDTDSTGDAVALLTRIAADESLDDKFFQATIEIESGLWQTEMTLRHSAIRALERIGPQAAPAAPTLLSIAAASDDELEPCAKGNRLTDIRSEALAALDAIGPSAASTLSEKHADQLHAMATARTGWAQSVQPEIRSRLQRAAGGVSRKVFGGFDSSLGPPPPDSRTATFYDGKSFDEWKAQITERKPERLKEVFKALGILGTNGHGREAAETILNSVRPLLNYATDEVDEASLRAAASAEIRRMMPIDDVVRLVEDNLSKGPSPVRRFLLEMAGTEKQSGAPPEQLLRLSTECLLAASNDADLAVRQFAANAIVISFESRFADWNGQDSVVKNSVRDRMAELLDESDEIIWWLATELLAEHFPESHDAVVKRFIRELPPTRSSVEQLEVLTQVKRESAAIAIPALIGVLHDKEQWYTKNVLTIGGIHEERGAAAMACQVLGKVGVGSDEAVQALTELVETYNPSYTPPPVIRDDRPDRVDEVSAIALIEAFAAIHPRGDEAISLLEDCAKRDDRDKVERAITEAIARIRGRQALDKPDPGADASRDDVGTKR